MEEKTEGLLLQAIPYLGHQKILKVFTPEAGLLSFMVKQKKFSQCSPFLVAEWVYRPGKEDLHLLKDLTILNDLSSLRESYTVLSLAGQMAKDLLHSQLPAKKGRELYALALAYLHKLPTFANPAILALSFRLKLLLHEGLLSIERECATCGAPPFLLAEGESVCHAHAPGHSLPYTADEWEAMYLCASARRFTLLEAVPIPDTLPEKIGILFKERLK